MSSEGTGRHFSFVTMSKRTFSEMAVQNTQQRTSLETLPNTLLTSVLSLLDPERIVVACGTSSFLEPLSDDAIVRKVNRPVPLDDTLLLFTQKHIVRSLFATCSEPRTFNVLLSILSDPSTPAHVLNLLVGFCFIPPEGFQLNTGVIAHIVGHDPRCRNACDSWSHLFLAPDVVDIPNVTVEGTFVNEEQFKSYYEDRLLMLIHSGIMKFGMVMRSHEKSQHNFISKYPRPQELIDFLIAYPEFYVTFFAEDVLLCHALPPKPQLHLSELPRDLVIANAGALFSWGIEKRAHALVDDIIENYLPDRPHGIIQAFFDVHELPFIYYAPRLAQAYPDLFLDQGVVAPLVTTINIAICDLEVGIIPTYRDVTLSDMIMGCTALLPPIWFLKDPDSQRFDDIQVDKTRLPWFLESLRNFPQDQDMLIERFPLTMWYVALEQDMEEVFDKLLHKTWTLNQGVLMMREAVKLNKKVEAFAKENETALQGLGPEYGMTKFVCEVVGVHPWLSEVGPSCEEAALLLADRPSVDMNRIIHLLEERNPSRLSSCLYEGNYSLLRSVRFFIRSPHGIDLLCRNRRDFICVMQAMDMKTWADFAGSQEFPVDSFLAFLHRTATFTSFSPFTAALGTGYKRDEIHPWSGKVLAALTNKRVYSEISVQEYVREMRKLTRSPFYDLFLAVPLLDIEKFYNEELEEVD